MKIQWLHENHKDRLLIFCNGWGMDGAPFAPLGAHDLDVLMCYDYEGLTLQQDLQEFMDGYREISLVAWSMGVWAGQCLFAPISERFENIVAINGTLCPIHDLYGIPVEIFTASLSQFSEEALLKFYRRMCRTRVLLNRFLAFQPKREIANQREELKYLLENADCHTLESSIYKDVVIADHDHIMYTDNQLRFWQSGNIHLVDGSHFLFYGWTTWDELLQDPAKSRKPPSGLTTGDVLGS